MVTLFISDLHLDSSRPATTDLFKTFLKYRTSNAEALYILGDLFETWIGDDDDDSLAEEVAIGLKIVADRHIPVYFLHGNRDFLLGNDFAAASGLTLLPEEVVIDLYGTPTLLAHGDTLCIDDTDYQALRACIRSPVWQAQVLALPLAQRREMAWQFRATSRYVSREKAAEITDVNQQAVVQLMRQYGVRHLIHGHTHRPAIHKFHLDGEPAERIVLGDWYEGGSVLCCDTDSCRLQTLRPA